MMRQDLVMPLITEQDLVPMDEPPPQPGEAARSRQPRRSHNLTLVDGKTFLCTTVAGDITPACSTDVGLFHQDTRFLSYLELSVNGLPALVLSSSSQESIVSQIELTNATMTLPDSMDLRENTVHIRREQLLSECFYDRFSFENFNLAQVPLTIELSYAADFADVFQVRGSIRKNQGTHYRPVIKENSLHFVYLGCDQVLRQTLIEFDPLPTRLSGHSATFELRLAPLQKLELMVRVRPVIDGHSELRPASTFHHSLEARRKGASEWAQRSTHFESSNEMLDVALAGAVADFHALQVPYHDPGTRASGSIIAAGIPWFATIFGRDSLIAAYQSLGLNPQLAKETLRYLALHQGTQMDDWRDEEPGKILHELREGEMAHCNEIPHSPYYGSVDSTPLFLVVLCEMFDWTGDRELVRELLPAVHKALEWMDHYGDLDGDGFVEYQCRSARGLANQGWKDSWDSNRHRDGTLAPGPIALCEVQGYVHDAKFRTSRLLSTMGEYREAERLRRDAEELAERIDKAFWMPEESYYAMALDGEKRPLRVISSNAGHLLFSRTISKKRARRVIERLMSEEMFSGWGIRTLSSAEPTYNPLSYHRGSVWPHDNSLIVQGLCFYNQKSQAQRVFSAMFQASLDFRNYELPELFCGVRRQGFDRPVEFPVSCWPQAWASGSLMLMLQSLLGIRPEASMHSLKIVNPALPEGLDWLRLSHLRVGDSMVSLEFNRHHKRTFCNLIDLSGKPLDVSIDFTEG